jgi:purine-nucleoside phosphorylase
MIGDADQALAALAARGITGHVDVAFVLGTGLSDLAQQVEDAVTIAYAEIPGFPRTSVSGHSGQFVFGRQQGRRVAYLQGRAHFYEDGDPRAMAVPLELLARLGSGALVLTAASGSLRPDMAPGSLMIVNDHINLSGRNPLIGVKGDGRFVSLLDAYDPNLRDHFFDAAKRAGLRVAEGVYMWFSGPSFETPAEIRMARTLGADAVGMSLVPEVILARALGLRVAAISMMTNYAAGFQGGAPTHDQTRAIAAEGALALQMLIEAFLKGMTAA